MRRALLLPAAALALALQSAEPDGRFDGEGKRGGAVSVALPLGEIRSYHPLRASDPRVRAALRPTWGTLTRVRRDTGETEPSLASSWSADESRRTWTFEIRPEAKWSDGKALTAGDVVFTIQALTDGANGFALAAALGRGEKAARAEAKGDRTVQIALPAPDPALPELLAEIPVLPEHKLGERARMGTLGSAWGVEVPVEEIVSAGPFRISRYLRPRDGDHILTLAPNPHFWRQDAKGQPLPYLAEVHFVLAKTAEAAPARLKEGKADVAEDLDAGTFRACAALPGAERVTGTPGAAVDCLLLRARPERDLMGKLRPEPPARDWLADPAFRRALAASIDRKRLGAAAEGIPLSPVRSFPWGALAARPLFPEDAEEARKGLEAAGWKRADGWRDPAGRRVALALATDAGSPHAEIAAELARQWKAFGIEASVETAPAGAALARIARAGDFEAALAAVEWEPGSWRDRLRPLLSPASGRLLWGTPSEAFPEQPWEARLNASWPMDEAAAAREANEALAEGCAMIPLLQRAGLGVTRKPLANLRPGRFRHLLTWNLDEWALR